MEKILLKNVTSGYAFIDMEQLFKWENEGKLDYILVDAGGYEMCIEDLKEHFYYYCDTQFKPCLKIL